MIEWSVRLGDILVISAMLVAVTGAYYTLKSDVRVLRHDFNSMKTAVDLMSSAMRSFSDVLTKIAVQETRVDRIEEDVKDLRHGRGFVGVKLTMEDEQTRR